MEAVGHGGPVLDGEVVLAVALEEMLPEEVHLPRQLLEVERDLEAARALRGPRGLALEDDQLVERLPVELGAARRPRAAQRFL